MHKNAKLIALFAAILVAFAELISCEQAVTGSTPKVDANGMVGNIPAERLGLIGKAPARSLSGLSLTTGSPVTSYTFPAFLAGIWEAEEWAPGLFDSFHLATGAGNSGYSLYGDWPLSPSTSTGWLGTFEAVYYFDGDAPEDKGLFFASFDEVYEWALVPPGTVNTISAFYYEKVPPEDPEDPDTYYILNLAKNMYDPELEDYEYGQPMYPTVQAALADLLQPGVLDDMLIVWVEYNKQP
jgi:hypothetical protein